MFAVIVTIVVLELKPPDQATFPDLWPLWPTAISYAVSPAVAVRHGMHRAHAPCISAHSLRWGLFVCIDIAHNVFERRVLADADELPRRGSLVVRASFLTAMLVAFIAPRMSLAAMTPSQLDNHIPDRL